MFRILNKCLFYYTCLFLVVTKMVEEREKIIYLSDVFLHIDKIKFNLGMLEEADKRYEERKHSFTLFDHYSELKCQSSRGQTIREDNLKSLGIIEEYLTSMTRVHYVSKRKEDSPKIQSGECGREKEEFDSFGENTK